MGVSKERLKTDLAAALRARDDLAKTTIRALLAAIKAEETSGNEQRELSDAEELAVLGKEERRRRESAATYAEAGRSDLASHEQSEAELISTYLPRPLDEDEIRELVAALVQALRDGGETPSMRQMGQVVRAVNEQAAGRADGATVARIAKAALTS